MDKKLHRLVCLFPSDTWVVQERMPSGDWMTIHNCTAKGREGYTEAKKWLGAKWLYRLEYKDGTNGLWYDGVGKWCFDKGIGQLDESCKTKTLPMDYDWRYRQDGKMWFSSCSNKEDLLHWYSIEDAQQLIANGFVFTRYLAVDFHEYENETVFLKETSIKREEIDFFELFKTQNL